MKRLLLVAFVAVALPAAAAAKGISALEVCGAAGCREVAVPPGIHASLGSATRNVAPSAPAPFVELRVFRDGTAAETAWYVPRTRLLAVRGEGGGAEWHPLVAGSALDDRIAAAARGVAPHVPRGTAAYVGTRRVQGDVSGYLQLFGVPSAGPVHERDARWVGISVKTAPPSPWALTYLAFSARGMLLQRGPAVVRLPEAVAADVEAARPIAPDDGRNLLPWLSVAALAAVLLVLAAANALGERRSGARAPQPA